METFCGRGMHVRAVLTVRIKVLPNFQKTGSVQVVERGLHCSKRPIIALQSFSDGSRKAEWVLSCLLQADICSLWLTAKWETTPLLTAGEREPTRELISVGPHLAAIRRYCKSDKKSFKIKLFRPVFFFHLFFFLISINVCKRRQQSDLVKLNNEKKKPQQYK